MPHERGELPLLGSAQTIDYSKQNKIVVAENY